MDARALRIVTLTAISALGAGGCDPYVERPPAPAHEIYIPVSV